MDKQKLLYIYPPDFQKSQKHRMAKRIFKGIQHNPVSSQCECCDRKIGIQAVETNCCYNIHDLAFLGPGVPLFFCYLKNAIILLLILIIIFVGFCIYSNLSSNYCSALAATCEYNIFNTLSIINKINQSDYLSIQNYILLGFTLASVFLFHWFRYNFRQIEQECDDIIDSPSDYAIILRRLPPCIEQKDIENMINQKRQMLSNQQREATQNLKIDHIVLSFSLSEYTKTKQQNIILFKQKIEQQKIQQFKPVPLPSFKQTASIAIVIFSKQESKQLFIYKPNIIQRTLQCLCTPCTPLSNFTIKGQPISIQRAPQPDDIVWQNTKISMTGAICRKTLYNILGVVILLLGGASQYGLALAQNQITDPFINNLLSIALSLVVTVFNFLILQFLVYTSQKERNQTLTQYNTVLTVKISFFQFLNTGIFVILGNFFADTSNFTLQKGMPFQICLVMIMNAISPNLSLWILNYFQISGKIFRWMIKNNKIICTQIQANLCWQSPPPQIPYKYAYILKTIWLTAFYAPFVPIVVIISMFGLILNYFIQRHLYGHVYSAPNMLSSMVNDSAIQLMQYFPLILSAGQFIIYLYFLNYNISIIPLNWQIPIYASLCLSFLNLFLPMDSINKCILHLPIDTMKFPPYEKVQHKFQVTYEMTNPAYVCQRKRKRDVFLFNFVFGGQGQNAALQMTNLFGLNSDNDNSAKGMKSPLIPKNKINTENVQSESNPFANLFKNNFSKGEQSKNQNQKILEQNLNQSKLIDRQTNKNKEQLTPGNKINSIQSLNKMINKSPKIKQNQFKQYKVQNSIKKQNQKINSGIFYKQNSQIAKKQQNISQDNKFKAQKEYSKQKNIKLQQQKNIKLQEQKNVRLQKQKSIKPQGQKNIKQQGQNNIKSQGQKNQSMKKQNQSIKKQNQSLKKKSDKSSQFRQNQIYNPHGRFNKVKNQTIKFEGILGKHFKGLYSNQNISKENSSKEKPFSSFFK